MKGILKAHRFEKKADVNLGDDQGEWEEQILGELIKNHPFLSDKMNNISIEEIDENNNRHIGSISLIIRPGTSIEIPIVVNGGVLAPLDMFAYEKQLYPLSESIIGDVCKIALEAGILDGRAQNMNVFMENAVADNTESDNVVKLSKMLELANKETISRLISSFGKYEKVAMSDYYSLFNDTIKLKDKAEKVAMEKSAAAKETKEWVGYAYPGSLPYEFNVIMYKRAMETDGEMIRTQKMNAEEMEKSNIVIYDEGHVNFKVAYSNCNECTAFNGSLAGKSVHISTDAGLMRGVIFDATDPVGDSVGDKVFVLDDGHKWGIVDRKPHVERTTKQKEPIWVDGLDVKNIEDAIGNFVCFITEIVPKGEDFAHKAIGPMCVDRVVRYNRLGEMENVAIIDCHDINMVRSRLIRTNVSRPALVDQNSDKFKKHYAKAAYDQDVYLFPDSYGIGILGDKIKLVSKETYDFTKKSAIEARADKHITIIRNHSSWDVIIQDNNHIKKLSFLNDNTFDAVCREEMGKYASQLEIPVLGKREYYIWED